MRLKVIILSKALVSATHQRQLEELARLPGVELLALAPPAWREPRVGLVHLERRFTTGYRLQQLPIAFNGQHHLHFYPTLGRIIAREKPAIFHVDEEAFNPATFLAFRAGLAAGARCCFFNWANVERSYPPPFNLFERYVFRHAAYGIAGNHEAATIVRRHGYCGPLAVLPQVGVDPQLFRPVDGIPSPSTTCPIVRQAHEPRSRRVHRPPSFTVGYLGRLVPEKGVLDLVEALAGLPERVRLRLVGDGVLRPQIERRAAELGLQARIELRAAVPGSAVPAELQQIDTLVLPSRTWPNWKEQFGRVLIEAMSCGIPVAGSSSGEIAGVIGEAGLIFPEGDIAALRTALMKLIEDPELHAELARRGRARVLEHYTQAALARQYYEIYRAML